MSSNFPKFIERVLTAEGGFSDDRNDPGNWTSGKVGEGKLLGTKFGIAANTFPWIDIKNLTREDAIGLYKKYFWDKINGDILPDAVAYSALDGAVNSGIQRSVQWLQEAAQVADDGVWGPVTAAAITRTDPNDLLLRYNAYRLRFMTRLKVWPRYGAGYANRISQNLLYGAEDN